MNQAGSGHTIPVTLTAVDGVALEGRLRRPAGPTVGAAVLCHPHPAFGGHMDVWLLPTMAAWLSEAGWASLRVNFRGVGRSQGHQTGGKQEHADVAGAVEWLRRCVPCAPVVAVGWSFGAMVALRLGDGLDGWIGIAPPTHAVPSVPLEGTIVPEKLPPRRTVVVGAHDQFFPPDSTFVLRPDRLVVVPDTDHFFFDRDADVAAAVVAAVKRIEEDFDMRRAGQAPR